MTSNCNYIIFFNHAASLMSQMNVTVNQNLVQAISLVPPSRDHATALTNSFFCWRKLTKHHSTRCTRQKQPIYHLSWEFYHQISVHIWWQWLQRPNIRGRGSRETRTWIWFPDNIIWLLHFEAKNHPLSIRFLIYICLCAVSWWKSLYE